MARRIFTLLLACTAVLTQPGCGSSDPGRDARPDGGAPTRDAGTGGGGGDCRPNEERACYTGPAGTEGVGLCKAGTQRCAADGKGFGPCTGEMLPRPEDCRTPEDEDCDGHGGCGVFDLRADNNRNGTIDLTDPSEDLHEDSWDATHGAIFLPNLDDDQARCAKSGSDDALAQCNDAADEVVNGPDDLLDLARLKTVPWPTAPDDASATLTVDAKAADRVRLFKKSGQDFTVFDPSQAKLSADELRAGVEFAIEGKDVLRDAAQWDGYAEVTLTVSPGMGPDGKPLPDETDTVRLRQAPLVFRHHLDPVERLYAPGDAQDEDEFISSLKKALTAAGGPPLQQLNSGGDQWTQDYFEAAYVSMPAAEANGQHVIRINVRSANYGRNGMSGLRTAGRVVYTVLRGKDTGGLTQYDPSHPNQMDTLNSFGNLETVPPFGSGKDGFPLGRVIRGITDSWYPDKSFDQMVEAQGVQEPILAIDTSWLLVGHVDETLSFMKAPTPRGWIMLVSDAAMAVQMLKDQQSAGHGSTPLFTGESNSPTIDSVLGDQDIMSTTQEAATAVAKQLDVIKATTGIGDDEIVHVPFLYERTNGRDLAYQPGMVNGISINDTTFFSPDPHGPVVDGKDIFKDVVERALAAHGIKTYWVEDWDLLHAQAGEIHCGTNVTRVVPKGETWWTSSR